MNNVDFRPGNTLSVPLNMGSDSFSSDSGVPNPPLITQYLRIAQRRKWLILGIIAVTLIIGLIVTLLMTPQYTATTTLEIQREDINIVQVQDVEREAGQGDQEFYQTQYGLLKAKSLAERVASDLKLGDNPGFFEMFDAPQATEWFTNGRLNNDAAPPAERTRVASEILLDNLEISPLRSSRLVDIKFTSPTPEFAAQVANAWASSYVEATLRRRFDATSYARKFLEDRLVQLRQRLDESERRLVAYASRQGIFTLPGASAGGPAAADRSIVAEDLLAINRELASATADRVRAQSRLRGDTNNAPETLQNSTVASLRQRRAELSAEYSKLLVQFEPSYPAARALQTQIEQLDRGIAREEQRVKGSLNEVYASSADREARLKTQVESLKGDLLDLRRRSIQYNFYQRDVDTNRALYDGLLQRYKEIGVAGGVGVNNIAVVDRANVPAAPSSPRLMLNLLIALFAGIALAAAAAWASEHVDEAIADPTEVERLLNLPMLGAIPHIGEEPLDALQDRKSPMAEAYLSVQTSLAFATDHGTPRSLAITSTRPGEGKTTTSYAIATTLARTGRKVLLVDSDMRSPSLHHLVNIGNEKGLSNYLSGDDALDTLITPAGAGSPSLMTAGPLPPNAAELLTTDRLPSLLAALQEKFDHVIFDAPPVMGLADAPLLASHVEGVIFVIESHGTRSSLARLATRRLEAAHARVNGVVLTKFEGARARYGYGYDYGYGYGAGTPKTAA